MKSEEKLTGKHVFLLLMVHNNLHLIQGCLIQWAVHEQKSIGNGNVDNCLG